jgi:hypothetical protein
MEARYHSIHDFVNKTNPSHLKAVGDTVTIVAWRLVNQ